MLPADVDLAAVHCALHYPHCPHPTPAAAGEGYPKGHPDRKGRGNAGAAEPQLEWLRNDGFGLLRLPIFRRILDEHVYRILSVFSSRNIMFWLDLFLDNQRWDMMWPILVGGPLGRWAVVSIVYHRSSTLGAFCFQHFLVGVAFPIQLVVATLALVEPIGWRPNGW